MLLAALSHIQANDAIVAVVVAVILALVVWLLFHLIAPPYEAVAAIVTFLVVLLAMLFL